VLPESTPGEISVNAHNIWWFLTLGLPGVPASKELLPGITYQILGTILFLSAYLASLVKVWRSKTSSEVFFGLGYIGFLFFMLALGMHENYLFSVLPFLAAVGVKNRRLALVYALLSLTFLFNMILHDPFIMVEYFYGLPFDQEYESSGLFNTSEVFMSMTHRVLTLLNAAVNICVFVYLSWWMFGRQDDPARPLKELAKQRPAVQS
jgi:hypothetical protein